MTLRLNIARRKARNGRGLLPPNPKQWDFEHNGLDLRAELRLPVDAPLDHNLAFTLLPAVTVLPHGQLPLAQVFIDHFRGKGSASWSGMAISFNDAGVVILYNDSHPTTRMRTTLMEEFFHLWLGHPPSILRVYRDDAGRSHDPDIENEAYGSGAAALVPYKALRLHVENGHSVRQIADFFEISPDLVVYRSKVTRLYSAMLARIRRVV